MKQRNCTVHGFVSELLREIHSKRSVAGSDINNEGMGSKMQYKSISMFCKYLVWVPDADLSFTVSS